MIVRVIAQQYSFVPSCIVVPADTQVVFRVTSPDVVHGFLITGHECEQHGGARDSSRKCARASTSRAII